MDRFEMVKHLNELIVEAVDHGGDPGGPYFCNKNKLMKKLYELLIFLKYDEFNIIEKDNYPEIKLGD